MLDDWRVWISPIVVAIVGAPWMAPWIAGKMRDRAERRQTDIEAGRALRDEIRAAHADCMKQLAEMQDAIRERDDLISSLEKRLRIAEEVIMTLQTRADA